MYLKKIQGGERVNKEELKAQMYRHGDTQASLAAAMGLSRTRLNAKINESNNASFTQPEILFIRMRYKLSAKEVDDIFFNQKVS